MAGRIRSIKPEILEDTKTATLSHLEYRLFTGSWLLADDHGNLRGDPDYVRGQVVWSSRESRESVAKALDTLVRVGLLTRYAVRGQVYYHVTNWEKHQRVDKPGKPRMPGPDQEEQELECHSRESHETPGNPRETPATDLRSPTSDPDPEGDPDVGRSRGSRKKPAHPLPDSWKPGPEHVALALQRGVDLAVQVAKFKAHAEANDRRCVRWGAAFTQWLLQSWPERKQPANQTTLLDRQLEKIAQLEREEAEAREQVGS